MSKKFHISLVLGLILLMMAGCQEEIEPTLVVNEEEVLFNDELAGLIKSVTYNDGSMDDIIDECSCLEVIFPVSGYLEDYVIAFNSIEEVLEYRSAALEIDWEYPIQFIYADYSMITLFDDDELDIFQEECSESFSDNECIDFEYPVDLQRFNLNNELLESVSILNDEQFFKLISDTNEIVSLQFPLFLTDQDDEAYSVDNNEELMNILSSINQCDEDDDIDYEEFFRQQRIDSLVQTEWKITAAFEEEENVTDSLQHYSIRFAANDILSVTGEEEVYEGEWRIELAGTTEILAFDIDVSDNPLELLNQEWLIEEFNQNQIRLRNADLEENQTLVLSKN